MCAQPCARKWVLREGMRGVLPELVRMRHGKSSMDGAFAHCLAREGNRLTRTVEGAEIAQLGIIEPGALRHAIQNGVSGGPHLRGHRLRPLYWSTEQRHRRARCPLRAVPINSGRLDAYS